MEIAENQYIKILLFTRISDAKAIKSRIRREFRYQIVTPSNCFIIAYMLLNYNFLRKYT